MFQTRILTTRLILKTVFKLRYEHSIYLWNDLSLSQSYRMGMLTNCTREYKKHTLFMPCTLEKEGEDLWFSQNAIALVFVVFLHS